MHQVPTLKYKYSDLEPHFDEATMRLHHTKHHQAYVDKLNAALESYPDLAAKSIEALLADLSQVPSEIRQAIVNHGGGHYNHCRFWEALSPNGGTPREQTIAALDRDFGGVDNFKEKFKAAALGHFGSGWAWLVQADDHLQIVTTVNQDAPWSQGKKIVLPLDVWEHSYYLKYQNRRADYVDAFFNLINWEQVELNIA